MLLESQQSGDSLTLRLSGDWCIENIREVEAAVAEIPADGKGTVHVDGSGVSKFDMSGAWLLHQRLDALRTAGANVEFSGQQPEVFHFLKEMAERECAPVRTSDEDAAPLRDGLAWIGRRAVQQGIQTRDAVGFFGHVSLTLGRSLRSLRSLRIPSIARHVYETGIQAIPIVSLIAFLISVIVAYLGAQQLQQFGAEIYTVDLVAIAVLREMGVLLTAIIVAGRSGSAFAAEIGVMRLNEEVDALQSMGVDYFEVLVLPRVIGLVIALPLLTIIADAMGLAGGALLSSLLLDISLTQFIPRVQAALAPTTFWAGLIKAPVFALLIAMVGTYRGMQVRDSSRELGRLTTVAVVQSIFLVIFADAVFAVVYVQLDF
ncbi:phospholipid/cholesterol/gamma-HCH transport system permease protein [Povalibacter uvarum]|uniref:Phospholipid/cholesterol/gamma-HCH transport system permease protein n=1 Tax=Povalibacter uvarum TaxID=732238 RepID=A0A841HIQ1_9GAMM|nr:MlaE family lipid ABC transporter permease subunit [Povalibacter uvarum]MBB6092686.1 phospholipid/cholesterol/gamma-HCH transport system permease protein [Povalibacter uvarum]